jgi:hypothetical protein
MAQGDMHFYNNFFEQLMKGEINLNTGGDAIRVALVDGYTPDPDNHDTWNDISGNECEGSGYTSGGELLGSQVVTQDDTNNRGKFSAADIPWIALDTGSTPSHVILYDVTAGNILICAIENTKATNGGNWTWRWPSGLVFYLYQGA